MPRKQGQGVILNITKIDEMYRLLQLGLTHREIARVLRISRSSIVKYREILKNALVNQPNSAVPFSEGQAEENTLKPREAVSGSDSSVFSKLTPAVASNLRFNQRKRDYVFPDFHKIHLELHSRKGMTIELLWEEYVTDAGEDKCYSYSHFAQLYSDFKNKTRLVLRQMHVAGDKAFVDFAGVSVPYYDRHSGEFKKAQIFVGVLGMSNYTFVKAVPSQKKEDFVRCLREMLEFFNGAPKAIVIDNLKAGVNKADRYDPELNPTLELFAKHYNTVIWPTAPRSPTHKAKAETGVQIVERYILARFRHKNFTGIAEIQREISQLLPSLNLRMMKSYGKSREELYLEYEKQNLMSLPASGFHYTTVQTKRVGHDYHVQYNKVYYSVPFHLAGQFVSLRKGERSIEIFHHNQCVATHAIGLHPWQHQTKEEHRPQEHQWLLVWPAKRLKSWAESIGPATLQMTLNLLMEVQYEEQASRKILARLQFANTFGSDALEDCIATFQKKYPQKVQKVNQMKQWLKLNYPVSNTPGYSHRAEPGTQFEREDGLLKNTDNLRGSDYYMEYLKDSPAPLQITASDSFKEVPNV